VCSRRTERRGRSPLLRWKATSTWGSGSPKHRPHFEAATASQRGRYTSRPMFPQGGGCPWEKEAYPSIHRNGRSFVRRLRIGCPKYAKTPKTGCGSGTFFHQRGRRLSFLAQLVRPQERSSSRRADGTASTCAVGVKGEGASHAPCLASLPDGNVSSSPTSWRVVVYESGVRESNPPIPCPPDKWPTLSLTPEVPA